MNDLPNNQKYVVSIGNRGDLVNETKEILRLYASGLSLSEIREKVIKENFLGKRALAMREGIFDIVKRRYFDTFSKDQIQFLSLALNSPLNETSKNLILYFHLCLFDTLVFDFVSDCAFRKYTNGALGISKLDVEAFLKSQEKNHPEILTWSASTRTKLERGLLASLSNFNILKGSKKKEFSRIYLPLEVFLYVCYFLKDQGLSAKKIVSSPCFRLFLLDRSDVLMFMNEAMKKGHLQFSYHGEIYDLKLKHNNLKEYVGELTGQI